MRIRLLRTLAAASLAATALALPAAATDVPSLVERWEADRMQVFDATELDLDEVQWLAHVVAVFAQTERDPAFIEQMAQLERELGRLAERDVIVVTDTDPDGGGDLRRELRPRGFMLALIAKDGRVAQRKPLPLTVRELTRAIDNMPAQDR